MSPWERRDMLVRRICGRTALEARFPGVDDRFNALWLFASTVEILLTPWAVFLWAKEKLKGKKP